jgi:hypothetical protein
VAASGAYCSGVHGVLSLPVLLLLAWGIGGLLWWDRRRRVIGPAQVSFTMTALALIVVAMALSLASLPAPPLEQLVRAALLVESAWGFATLARRGRRGGNDER